MLSSQVIEFGTQLINLNPVAELMIWSDKKKRYLKERTVKYYAGRPRNPLPRALVAILTKCNHSILPCSAHLAAPLGLA